MPEGVHAGGLVRHDRERRVDAERRVVVQGVVGLGSVVHHVVALGGQVADQVGAQLHAGVVGGDVDARECRSCGHGRFRSVMSTGAQPGWYRSDQQIQEY